MNDMSLGPSLPTDPAAETALLGAMLDDNRQYERALEAGLDARHFSVDGNRVIFEAIATVIGEGKPADGVTLVQKGIDRKAVASLLASTISLANVPHYARILRDLWTRREMIRACRSRMSDAMSTEGGDAHLAGLESDLFAIAETPEFGKGPRPIADIMPGLLDRIDAAAKRKGPMGIPTGLADLDRLLGGMEPQNVIILAARPSMGKSALAVTIGDNAACKGMPVGVFSLEMSAEEIATRMLARRMKRSGFEMQAGRVDVNEFHSLTQHASALRDVPLYVDDTPGITIPDLLTRARRMKRRHNIGLLIVDHLGLMRATDTRANRTNQVGEISRGLKMIAKDLNIPVLALCQLNRGVEQRDNKRPLLSDLRDSGDVEQDADVVMFLYRDHYYLSKDEPQQRAGEHEGSFLQRHDDWTNRCVAVRNIAELHVAKHRSGPCGTVKLRYDDATTTFSNLINEVPAA